jgi:UDP-N-acetylmuramoyl-tripeptide--D-alanyl-D-alanine ligase
MPSVLLDASRKVAGWVKTFKQARAGYRNAAKLREANARREASSATFIGITGSSAKTTTAALLGRILKGHDSVTERVDSNTLMPLANTLRRRPLKDRYVVAELGLSKVDSIRLMAELLKPDVAIVTLIDLEHYSVFRTREAVAAEKGTLVSNIRPGGFAVLNADDEHVMAMAARTAERIVTFGRATGVDYRATDIHAAFPERLSLTIEWTGGRLALQTRYVAEHFWLPVTAAVAAALELGVPPQTVAEQVAGCEPFHNRLSVAAKPDAPQFIVDTTKAPWHSVLLAFKALADAKVPRKRLILGHLSDFPGSDSKYRKAYAAVRPIADQVVFVGDHSHRSKASQQDRDEGRFVAFATPREVAEHIRSTATPGELILIKGSSDLHLERIALSWTGDVKCWVPVCGLREGCQACGLYGTPYEVHRGRRNWRRHERLRRMLTPWKVWAHRRRAIPPKQPLLAVGGPIPESMHPTNRDSKPTAD